MTATPSVSKNLIMSLMAKLVTEDEGLNLRPIHARGPVGNVKITREMQNYFYQHWRERMHLAANPDPKNEQVETLPDPASSEL